MHDDRVQYANIQYQTETPILESTTTYKLAGIRMEDLICVLYNTDYYAIITYVSISKPGHPAGSA